MQAIISDLGTALALLSSSKHPDDGVTDTLLQAMSSLTKYTRDMDARMQVHKSRESQAIELVEEMNKVTRKQKAVIETMKSAAAEVAAKEAELAARTKAEATANQKTSCSVHSNTELTGSVLDPRVVSAKHAHDLEVLHNKLGEKDRDITRLRVKLSKKDDSIARLKDLLAKSQDIFDAQHSAWSGNGISSENQQPPLPPPRSSRPKLQLHTTDKHSHRAPPNSSGNKHSAGSGNGGGGGGAPDGRSLLPPRAGGVGSAPNSAQRANMAHRDWEREQGRDRDKDKHKDRHDRENEEEEEEEEEEDEDEDEEEDEEEEEEEEEEGRIGGTDGRYEDDDGNEEFDDFEEEENSEFRAFDPLARFGHGLNLPTVARSASAPEFDLGDSSSEGHSPRNRQDSDQNFSPNTVGMSLTPSGAASQMLAPNAQDVPPLFPISERDITAKTVAGKSNNGSKQGRTLTNPFEWFGQEMTRDLPAPVSEAVLAPVPVPWQEHRLLGTESSGNNTAKRTKTEAGSYTNFYPSREQKTEAGAGAGAGAGAEGEISITEVDQTRASASLLAAYDSEETDTVTDGDNSQVELASASLSPSKSIPSDGSSPSPQRLRLSPRLRERVANGSGHGSGGLSARHQNNANLQPQQQEKFAAAVTDVTDSVDDSFELIQRYYLK